MMLMQFEQQLSVMESSPMLALQIRKTVAMCPHCPSCFVVACPHAAPDSSRLRWSMVFRTLGLHAGCLNIVT